MSFQNFFILVIVIVLLVVLILYVWRKLGETTINSKTSSFRISSVPKKTRGLISNRVKRVLWSSDRFIEASDIVVEKWSVNGRTLNYMRKTENTPVALNGVCKWIYKTIGHDDFLLVISAGGKPRKIRCEGTDAYETLKSALSRDGISKEVRVVHPLRRVIVEGLPSLSPNESILSLLSFERDLYNFWMSVHHSAEEQGFGVLKSPLFTRHPGTGLVDLEYMLQSFNLSKNYISEQHTSAVFYLTGEATERGVLVYYKGEEQYMTIDRIIECLYSNSDGILHEIPVTIILDLCYANLAERFESEEFRDEVVGTKKLKIIYPNFQLVLSGDFFERSFVIQDESNAFGEKEFNGWMELFPLRLDLWKDYLVRYVKGQKRFTLSQLDGVWWVAEIAEIGTISRNEQTMKLGSVIEGEMQKVFAGNYRITGKRSYYLNPSEKRRSLRMDTEGSYKTMHHVRFQIGKKVYGSIFIPREYDCTDVISAAFQRWVRGENKLVLFRRDIVNLNGMAEPFKEDIRRVVVSGIKEEGKGDERRIDVRGVTHENDSIIVHFVSRAEEKKKRKNNNKKSNKYGNSRRK